MLGRPSIGQNVRRDSGARKSFECRMRRTSNIQIAKLAFILLVIVSRPVDGSNELVQLAACCCCYCFSHTTFATLHLFVCVCPPFDQQLVQPTTDDGRTTTKQIDFSTNQKNDDFSAGLKIQLSAAGAISPPAQSHHPPKT